MLHITYGIDAASADDKYFRTIEDIAAAAEDIATPGKFLVEAVPSMRYLPSWLPGGGFKRYAANARDFLATSQNELYEAAIDSVVSRDRLTAHSRWSGPLT